MFYKLAIIDGTYRKERRNLRYLLDSGGQVMSSEFVTGVGRNTKALDIPGFCKKIHKDHAKYYPRRVQKLFEQHPRCQYVVAITNMRAAHRLIKLEDEILDELSRLDEPLICDGAN